jgi:hypothetical protein
MTVVMLTKAILGKYLFMVEIGHITVALLPKAARILRCHRYTSSFSMYLCCPV